MGIEFRVLGPLEVLWDGAPVQLNSPKQRLLLAVLLVRANEMVSVDALVDALWGGHPPASATGVVRTYVSHLRKVLERGDRRDGPQVLRTVEPGYRLVVESDQLDARRFERLLSEAYVSGRQDRAADAARLLEQALSLWRGAALADVADEDPVRVEASRLDGLRLVAIEERVAADIVLGRHGELVDELAALVQVHPLRERFWGQLMLCLYRVGRQADALAAYRQLRDRLTEELGLHPSRELAHLERAILAHAPWLEWVSHDHPTHMIAPVEPVPTSPVDGTLVRRQAETHGPVDDTVTIPLPAALTVRNVLPLVGRSEELRQLRDAWQRTRILGRRVVLVAGEPGVGKTRLAQELAREAHGEGAVVLMGRCDDAVPAPLRPVVELVRQAVQHQPTGPDVLTSSQRVVLERLLQSDWASQHAGSDAATEALSRLEAIDALLVGLAGTSPVLVVFDDLHWADPATLLLVRHLAMEPSSAPVLVMGTFRDTDLDETAALADTLADLRRTPGTERLTLRGLDQAATAALVEAWTGGSAHREVSTAIFARTEGNPFFVGEVLQHLAETAARSERSDGPGTSGDAVSELGIPPGVRETVGRRLLQLGPAANEVLSVAAVAGREFDLDIVADALGSTESAALDALEPAVARQLVTEEHVLGRYQFSHTLVRFTLLESLATLRRVRLHQRVGDSIERRRPHRLFDHADELAYHFGQAAAVGESDRAIRYCVLAAERAASVGDPTAIEGHVARALAVHDAAGVDDADREMDLVVRLVRAINATGDVARARPIVERALNLAARSRDHDHIVLALDASGTLVEAFPAGNADLVARGEDLLRTLPRGDSPARAAVLTWRAWFASYSMASRSEYETALANGEAAVAMARRVSPPEIVATALTAQNNCLLSLWQPQRALELIREVEAAQSPFTSASRTVARVWVSFRALVSLLQLGERDEIDRIVMLLHGDQGATALGFQRAFLEQHAAALALAEGRLDDAEARVARALEWAPDHPNIVRSASAQRWAIRLEQDGIDPHRLDVMSKSRPTPWLEALAALVHAEHGDLDEAAAALKVFATREDLGIPFNTGQAPTLRALAETAAHVGDAPFARALTPYVAPYTGQLFAAFFGHFCDGAADRALGQLALAQDDPDTAVAHLHAALALEDDFRAPALTARTRYWLALALGARNHAGDDEEAEREAASAARTAGSCGLVSIQHLVERLEHSGRALGVVQRDAD